jgi:hypothetical protein
MQAYANASQKRVTTERDCGTRSTLRRFTQASRRVRLTAKGLKPQPTRQAKLVAWHLTFRVPLNLTAIPESDIKQACERFGMSLDTWQRQKHAFGLLKKVCAKRAKLRGESNTPSTLDAAGEVS